MADPATNVARSAIEPAAAVALEQSLTRLPPGAIWPAQPRARFLPSGSTKTATARRSVESQTAAHGQRGDASRTGGAARIEAKPATLPTLSGAALGTRIGVIADNHGYLDPAVLEIFAGVSHVIHAGDIMDLEILGALQKVRRSRRWPETWIPAIWPLLCRVRSRARWPESASSWVTSASGF